MLFSSVTKNKRAISKIKKQESASWLYSFLLLVFSFLSVVSLTYAATTLGNNIFTSGTLTSQGKAYLTGGVSTPVLNATSSLTDNLKVTQNALLSQATIPTLNSTSSLIDNLNVKVNLAVQGLTQLATTTSFNVNKVVIVDGKHYPANSTGIQEAIDSLGPGGGKVFLPAGTYPITATTTLPSNVWLQGAGASSTILYLANNANTTILTNSDPVNGNSHIKISDLMVYGNKINNTHSDNNGVLFTNVTNSEIVDTRVRDCHDAGILINPGSNNVIERNEIENNSTGIAIYQNTSLENAIVGNRIEGNSGSGIVLGVIYVVYGGQKNLIKGNIISNNGGNGISGWVFNNNVIVNNNIIGNHNNISTYHSDNNIISNNVICDASWDNIFLDVTNYSVINNNYFCSPNHYNLDITFSDDNIIANNVFYGVGTDLSITKYSDYNILSGNRFSGAVVDDMDDTIYSSQPLNNDNIILKSIGNVGIGTTNPLTRLSVLKADTASSSLTTLLSLSHTASGGYGHPGIGSGLSFINQSTLGDSTTTAEIASIYNASSTAPEGNLIFFTKNSLLPPQERMVITGQGNVGIGTTAPTEKLEVNGNVLFGIPPSSSYYNIAPLNMANNAKGELKTQINLINGGGSAGAGSAIDFYTYTDVPGSTGPGARMGAIDDGRYSANFVFFTKVPGSPFNPIVERMRIASNGNVGIASTTPEETLTVGGNIYANGSVTSTKYIALPTVKFIPTATPTNPKLGQCFMDNGAKPQVSCYDGTTWHTLW